MVEINDVGKGVPAAKRGNSPMTAVEPTEFAFSLPTERVHLCAIHPTKMEKITRGGKTFEQAIIRGKSFDHTQQGRIDAGRWIDLAQRRRFGVYFNFNDLRKPLDRFHPKAHEGDVSTLHFLHLDADVDKTITEEKAFAAAKAALLKTIKTYSRSPSLIIDSGNGFGVFWLICPGLTVTDSNRLDLKSRNKALRNHFHADACENLDRVMRLPYTLNIPNAAKIRRGRRPVMASIVQDDRAVMCYGVGDFPLSSEPPVATSPSGKAYEAIGEPDIPEIDERAVAQLPMTLRRMIVDGGEYRKIGDGSRSAAVYYVACELRRQCWTDGEIVSLLTDPDYGISDHILDQRQRNHTEQASRVIVSMNNKGVVVDPLLAAVRRREP